MKISIDKIMSYHNTVSNTKRAAGKEKTAAVSGRNFDEIMIHTSARKVEESQFADQVSRKLMSSVMEDTPQEKIQALKEQVENGTYTIDTGAIASKILLQSEEQ